VQRHHVLVRVSGVNQSFDDCYAVNYTRLTVQLFAFVGDMTEAQDLVQEAFTRAWPRWEKISAYDDPVAWVRRVAWNLATSHWRRVRIALRHSSAQRPEIAEGPGPDRVALIRALSRLPARQRRAIVLHHLAGLSVAEVARDCEVAEGTVRSWLHRGRTAMAEHLSTSESPKVVNHGRS